MDMGVTALAATERRLDETTSEHHRPLYDELDWDDRLVVYDNDAEEIPGADRRSVGGRV